MGTATWNIKLPVEREREKEDEDKKQKQKQKIAKTKYITLGLKNSH